LRRITEVKFLPQIRGYNTMNNVWDNTLRNGAEKPGEKKLILPMPDGVIWIRNRGAIRKSDGCIKRWISAIKETD
jgi:hypothetical protein